MVKKINFYESPQVIGAEIDFTGVKSCDACDRKGLMPLFEVENYDCNVAILCNSCAITYSQDKELIDILNSHMSKVIKMRDQYLDSMEWTVVRRSKEISELDELICEVNNSNPELENALESQQHKVNGDIYYVNYEENDETWTVKLKTRVPRAGTSRQLVPKYINLPGAYPKRDSAKLYVYDYVNQKILINIIKIYRKSGTKYLLEQL